MKNKYNAYDLDIETVSYITCSNCGKYETKYEGNEEDFFYKGWRMTKAGNQYCPECANKKLKLNKNEDKKL